MYVRTYERERTCISEVPMTIQEKLGLVRQSMLRKTTLMQPIDEEFNMIMIGCSQVRIVSTQQTES